MMRLIPLETSPQRWSGSAARKDLKQYASGPAGIDFNKYGRGFLYAPPGARRLDDFKLPIANVYETASGSLVLRANKRAIEAAAASLEGARGGVDVPAAAVPRLRKVLERYYAKLGQPAPWPPYGFGTPSRACETNTSRARQALDDVRSLNPSEQLGLFQNGKSAKDVTELEFLAPTEFQGASAVELVTTSSVKYDRSKFGQMPVALIVEYTPRKARGARQLAAFYEDERGQKVPKGTRWLRAQRTYLDWPDTREGGWLANAELSAHRSKSAAKQAAKSEAKRIALEESAAVELAPDVDELDELTTAAELEPAPIERPSDLTDPVADGEPLLAWVWQPSEVPLVVALLKGVGRSEVATARAEGAAMRAASALMSSSRSARFSVDVGAPSELGGNTMLVVIQADTAAARKILAKLTAADIAEAFTLAWTELYGAAALDAYEETHWGEAAKTVDLIDGDSLTPKGTLVGLGELVEATYRTTKGGGALTDYVHTFGETGEAPPVLAFDELKRLFIVGGGYTVTSAGIEG